MFVRGTFDCLISQIIAEFEGSCYNTRAPNEPSQRLKLHNLMETVPTLLGNGQFG